MAFQRDLAKGDKFCSALKTFLGRKFKQVRSIEDTGDPLYAYDIAVDNVGTIEAKFDIRSASTGNFAFEVAKGCKPNGLTVSEADYLAYGDGASLWIMRRLDVLRFARRVGRLVWGGDNNGFLLLLVPIHEVEQGISHKKYPLSV